MSLWIGIEHEFNIRGMVYRQKIEEYGLVPEFYSYQWEYNAFLMSTQDYPLHQILKLATDVIIEIGKAISSYTCISEEVTPIENTQSIVSNGLHIHISNREKPYYSDRIEIVRGWVVKRILDECPLNLRFLFSHHIWGAYRPSKYNFKKKRRFAPAVFTSKGTVEIRALSFFDLLDRPEFVEELIKEVDEIMTADSYSQIRKYRNEAKKMYDILYSDFFYRPLDYENFEALHFEILVNSLPAKEYDFKYNDFKIKYPLLTAQKGELKTIEDEIRFPINYHYEEEEGNYEEEEDYEYDGESY